jgi:hypothetical protein
MKGLILLNANDSTHQVEEEEKSVFLKAILENIGVPIENIWAEDNSLTMQGKVKLHSTLSSYNMVMVDDRDGGLKIYVDKDIIGIWKKPSYILKMDHSQIDPKKKLFLEMHTDCWTVFENADG